MRTESGTDGFVVQPTHVADPELRRRLLPWAIAGVTLIVLLSAAVGFTYTPYFRASAISVSGESHLSEAAVLRIAGLGPDTNVFHMDRLGAEQRLEHDPWIKRATVTRSLPHTLTVVVSERTSVAIVTAGKTAMLVAADGTLLGPAAFEEVLPHIATLDSTGADTTRSVRVGGHVVAAMPTALRPLVESVAVELDGSVTVQTTTGVTVTYGDTTQLVAKGQSLLAVIDYARSRHMALAAVDVTVPGAPTASLPSGIAVLVGR
jgi:cell division protein FtsQ